MSGPKPPASDINDLFTFEENGELKLVNIAQISVVEIVDYGLLALALDPRFPRASRGIVFNAR